MKKQSKLAACVALACIGVQCSSPQKEATKTIEVTYPETRKDSVVDNYFGTEVADPYRWLEDDRSAETEAWVKAQNKVTFDYLAQLPNKEAIKSRLTELWNYEKVSAPVKKGNYYFYYKNNGIQNQSVLYIANGPEEEGHVLLDPNTLSADGTTSLGASSLANDSKHMAFSLSHAGSDWSQIVVMDVESGAMLSDTVDWVKFSGISWFKDGFFYSAYSKPTGSAYSGKNEYHKIFYHKLGTAQAADQLIYEDKDHALRNFYCGTSHDERFLIISGSESTSGNSFAWKDLSKGIKAPINWVVNSFENDYEFIDNEGDILFFKTNNAAPNGRIATLDTKAKNASLVEFIPEREYVLENASFAGKNIVCQYLKDVASMLVVFDKSGKEIATVSLPGLGIVGGYSASMESDSAYFTFENYTTAPSIYRHELTTGKVDLVRKSTIKFDGDAYETKQVFYTSADGAKIPMYITHKKGMQLNGHTPTFLYGYGGFNISVTPRFSPVNTVFLENGGVYAVANLRGGGEYGEAWHSAGTKLNKQNVFNDFIAAAEYLIKEGYTDKDHLAIHGRSNGGLLVGATMTQRPDLFKVALPGVGVLDMLRYHKFTIGWAWETDYGSSDDSLQFTNLIKYSPVHNVKAVAYPATMVLTGDHDDRVVPAHSFKFAAQLQAHQQGPNPTLIRIDVNAGHGAGKPVSKSIDEWSDVWTFVFYHLGMTTEKPAH